MIKKKMIIGFRRMNGRECQIKDIDECSEAFFATIKINAKQKERRPPNKK